MNAILNLCSYPLAIFNDDEQCIHNYRPIYSKGILFTAGYLTYDIGIILFSTQSCFRNTLGVLYLVHHSVCVIAVILCVAAGQSLPLLAQISYTCEISIIFYNIRELYGKDAKGWLPWINKIVFVLCTTLFRVVMFSFLMKTLFQTRNDYDEP